MAFLYLRFLIGGAAVVFVALVAVATLGLSVTIAFRTLRDNAEQSVVRLGTATAVTTDAFFAAPALRLKTLASLPRWTPDATTTPSDDPAFIPGTGGPTFEKWRRALIGFAVQAQFTEFSNDALFTDGSGCRTFPVAGAPVQIYGSQCGVRNGTGLAKHVTIHDIPSGYYNPVFTAAFLPRFAAIDPPTLMVPAFAALWEQRLQNTSDGDVTWAAPVGVNSLGEDYFVVTAATRILNATGRIGVSAVYLRLEDIGKILTAAKLTASTEVFVYDQDQFLIGASSAIRTFAAENFTGLDATPGCTTTAASASIYPSDVQRRMCRHHLSRAPFGPLAKAAAAEPTFFAAAATAGRVRLIKGNYIFAQRLPTLTGAQQLFLVTLTPESDVLGDAKTILPISAGVTAGIVVFVAAVSFVLVWLVLRPLQGIAERMGKAARLEEDDAEVAISPIAEIGDLQRAFVEMRDELGRIRAFVPQALLRANSGDDDEEVGFFADSEDLSAEPSKLAYQRSKQTDTTEGTPTSLSSSMRSQTTARFRADPTSPGAKKKINHMTGTRREAVAVLCVNLRGFHGATERGLDGEKMAAVVDAVLAAAHRERGVVDSFHGDRFMVTFNAAKPCANHGIRATLTAAHIAARLRGDCKEDSATYSNMNESSSFRRPRTLYDLPVTCGVAVGAAQVGNVGSAAMKSFTVVGPVVSQAAVLERMCKVFPGAQCLVPQRLFADLTTAVQLRTLDYVQLPFAQKPCLVADVLGEHQSGGDDEWMYQLHARERRSVVDADGRTKVDVVQVCNATWALLAEGRGTDAGVCFAQLPEGFNEDPASPRGTDAVQPISPSPTPLEHLASCIDAVRKAGSNDAPPVRDLGLFYKAITL